MGRNTKVAIRDVEMMQRALGLAREAVGSVWPNPAVGCVIVRNEEIVGEAATGQGGRPHAERRALEIAGHKAEGATAYVSLEPCAHVGRTGPCAEALVKAGVQRVVIATKDPDPRVNGRGVEMLLAAGIAVDVGICEKDARQVNAGFFHRLRKGVPLVTRLDPDIAVAGGFYSSLAQFDAVVTSLAAFAPASYPDVRYWYVLDSPDMSPDAFFRSVSAQPVRGCLVAADGKAPSRTDILAPAFSEVLHVPSSQDNGIDFDALLCALGERGLTHIAVDGAAVPQVP